MENASKALLMAGGVLIALLILTLLVYLATSTTRMANSQDQRVKTEQTIAFNKEYEAYDKTKMYGIDVISVMNKAIDYNKRLDAEDDEYKINIILNLKQNFDRTKEVVTQKGNGQKTYKTEIEEEGTLKTGSYSLFERLNSTKMNDDVLQFFAQTPEDTRTEINRGATIETTFTYSAITNFKTSIFKCENVEYSEITGRVNSMTFTQI